MADRQDALPGDLPLFSSGLGAGEWDFVPGDEFWRQVARIGQEGALNEQMDAAMAGKSSPRVWLILHEPGQPELSATVALAFARELGGRDQAALVLDCDDQSQSLTGWAERLESEGWIDLARYGTSVLTSGVPMPYDGRRGYLLGVGSFAPTDVTAAEIEQVVKRLRRQADDLILVAPADHIGQLWAPVAGIRLLCWDRSTRAAADIAGLVAGFAATEHPLTGLVGFGLPMAVADDDDAVSAGIEDGVAAQLPEAEVDADPVADDFETPVAVSDEPLADIPEEGTAGAVEANAADGEVNDGEAGWSDAPAAARGEPEGKGTSGVFWFLAVAAVVIVGIMSVYWFQYVRETELVELPVVALADRQVPDMQRPIDRAAGELVNQDDSSSGAVQPVIDDERLVGIDTTGSVADTLAVVAATDGGTATNGGHLTGATESAVQEKAVQEKAEATPEPAAPVFSMVPYREQVGSGGWALHLYSFSDSTGAKTDVVELHRRGFETEIRVVETLKKGRWWRVYVGSFATKAEARAAARLLKKKLRTDWANPTRF